MRRKYYYVIFNNSTPAPGSVITEFDDIFLELIRVREDRINDWAWAKQCSRAHLYERKTSKYGTAQYHYVATQATTYQ